MRTLWVSGASILATVAVAGVQLFNALLWTAYVTFLPDLVRSTGLGPEVVPLILLVDQLIFVVMDPLCGVGVQSLARRWWLVGPLLLGGLFISSIALLVLPSFSHVGAPIFLALLFIWVMTASVLRAPVMALLHRHVPPHAFPGAAGVSLLGLGLAGALSPYFGILIKTLHPLLPFAAASAAVLLSALTLMIAEFLRGPPEPAPVSQGSWLRLGIVLIGFSSLALAFQLHSMVRMVPLWSALMGSESLPMVMPTFWIGFSLAIAPLGLLSRRWPLGIVCGAGLLFTLGTLLSTLPFFPGLLAGQLLAGLGWAGVFVGALSSVARLAPSRWMGLAMGGFFCVTSLATLARIAITMSGLADRLGSGIDVWVVLLALGGVGVAGLTGGWGGLSNGMPSMDDAGWAPTFGAFLLATCATLGSLFFSEVMRLPPCSLCWYQRIFMFPLPIILLFGLIPYDTRVARYALPLAMGGLGVALWHTLLYWGILPEAAAPCVQGVPCTQPTFTLLGVFSIPVLSLLAFVGITGLLFLQRRRVSA